MSAWQNDLVGLGATQLTIGLSSILRFIPGPYQNVAMMKYLSGGSVEIVTGSSTGGTGWGTGYLIGTAEVINVMSPATFYLAASGATAKLQVVMGFTSGATLV